MSISNQLGFHEAELKRYLVRRFSELRENEFLGIRTIKQLGNSKEILNGLYNNYDCAVKDVIDKAGSSQIYCGLNPIQQIQGLMINGLASGNGFSDVHVARIIYALIDVDPARAANTASTQTELQHAWNVIKKISDFLNAKGVIHRTFGSGNGFHILIRVPSYMIDGKSKLKSFLEYLDGRFSTPEAHVDTTVHNPSRICRMFGTLNIKGQSSLERPHRMSFEVDPKLEAILEYDILNIFADEIFQYSGTSSINNLKRKSEQPRGKGNLSQKTLDFIAHGEVDGKWHPRLVSATFDLKKNNFSHEEAIIQIKKASVGHYGDLTQEDLRQIKDIYENRTVDPKYFSGTEFNQGQLHQESGPQPLFRQLPPPPQFPVEALGKVLAPAVTALIELIKAPPALCAQSVLGASTLAVQSFKDVTIDGRTFPTSQFFLTIGESGERKTAVDNIALKAHREIERSEIEKFEVEYEKYKQIFEADSAQRKRIVNDKKLKKDEIARMLGELGSPPIAPISRIMLMQEPTFEGLIKMLEHGRPSVGLFSDEGGRMVGGHGMNTDNQLKTMSGFCSLWDGKAVSKVRAETGSTNLYGKRFSIHLMMQPIVALQLTGNSMATEQGFLARCLTTYPDSTVGTRKYHSGDVSQDFDILKFHSVMKNILYKPMPLQDQGKNVLQPLEMNLTVNAKATWIEFHDFVEENLAENGKFHSIRGFGAKAAEHAIRLAATLTLVENIDATTIEDDKMKAGILLMGYYLAEALRLFSVSAINPELIQAEKLLKWCHRQNEFIYTGQVYKSGPSSMRDKKSAQKAISILVDHGHLLPVAEGMTLDGRHRKQVWKVEKCTEL